jgi:hypothetical protein
VPVGLRAFEASALLQPRHHQCARLLLREAGEISGLAAHPPVGADDRQLGQLVAPADLEVDGVVAGRDLERAGSERGLDGLVRDHRNAALDVGDDDLAAHDVAVALVRGMHGDGDVGQDRGRANGRDRHASFPVGERVARVDELVVHLLVDELQVREGSLVEGAPVDDPVRAVDPALPIEVDEEAHDRAHVFVVHREALAPVVHRRAHPAELAHDRPAVLVEPVPDDLLERLAPDLLARLPLRGQVLLDGVLGRDARMVVAGEERRFEATHAVPAHERVREGDLERMAGVQRARHVRRRMRDDERRPPAAWLGRVEALFFPDLLPAFFDALRAVQRLHPSDSRRRILRPERR